MSFWQRFWFLWFFTAVIWIFVKIKMSSSSKKPGSPSVSIKSGSAKSGGGTPGSTASKSSMKAKPSKIVDDDDPILVLKPSLAVPKEIQIVSDEPGEYKPIPYTFKVLNNAISVENGSSLQANYARCPPFYIQLDHALAVIWTLFSREKTQTSLGVVQLQWALSFLKGLRSPRGSLPQDISVVIDALEEALIEQYAGMASSIKSPSKSDSKESHAASESDLLKDTLNLGKPKLRPSKAAFSVNYAEMSKFKPNQLEQIFNTRDGVSMTEIDIQREIDKMKQVVSSHVSESGLADSSKDNMVEFLKSFRKEQITKIQEELKRLHSIETFIGNIDKDNFEPYLTNRQLGVLEAQRQKSSESAQTDSKRNSKSNEQ